MPGFAPAYIGKPPPHWKRKREEWEQRQALQQERERELSPAVPDPPVTPSRSVIFGSPSKSARVYKTYAHKRARSRASSVADEGDDAPEGGSRESSNEPSPTKVSSKPAYNDPKPPSISARRGQSRTGRQAAEASTAIARSASRGANSRRHPSSPNVYVELAQRRHPPDLPSETTAPVARAEPSRGRTRDPKAISLPSPSSTSQENADPRPRKRARLSSSPGMSLSEALNRSFARANAGLASPRDAAPIALVSTLHSAAGPSHSPNVPLKRKPGRPRSRGRGRGLGQMEPVVSHSALAAASGLGSGVQPTAAEEEEESAGEDVAPFVPAKRPRGRPRKDSAPQAPSRTPSRPRRSVSRRRSSGHAQLSSDAEAVTAQLTEDFDTPSQMNLEQSVDVLPVARALQEQAMREGEIMSPSASKKPRGRPKGSKNKTTLEREALARAAASAHEDRDQVMQEEEPSPAPRPRGRPRGSKNRATLEREAIAKAAAERALAPNPVVPSPVPVKRGPGRPRKSAPNPPTIPLGDTVDYMEPLRDPDSEDVPHPSTLHPGRRGRSRTRRNSTPAAPPPAYYLDMTTLQWKPRARSVSASPSKRKANAVEGTEYQTSGRLCAALKQKLLAAPHPKMKGAQGEDDGLRVSRSGALVFADKSGEEQGQEHAPTFVFRGSWEVIADQHAVCDDALVLKTLHDIVKRLGICINFGEEGPIFARSDDGRTVAIAVPCGCLSLQERSSSSSSSGSAGTSSPPPECAGEMTVSITEKEAETFPGEKAHRVTVMVMH